MENEVYKTECLYPLQCWKCKKSLGCWIAIFVPIREHDCMFLCDACENAPWPLSETTLHSQEKSPSTRQ